MLSGRASCFALCLTLALGFGGAHPLYGGTPEPGTDPVMPRVRGMTPKMRQLIEIGTSRSATFKSLIQALSRSDVVVFLETTADLPARLDGRLVFLTSAGGVRYLHVQLTHGLNVEELIPVAAHELQHALEVAMHPEVRNAETLRLLYQRIGIPSTVKDRYDTMAAQLTGKRVRAELG